MRGILSLRGSHSRFVLKGVHRLFGGREDRPLGGERRASDLVFIGRNLDREQPTRVFWRLPSPEGNSMAGACRGG